MARPRRPDEPSSYEGQPEVPPELQRRLSLIQAVLGGQMTISEAARELSIARVNMQTMVHRAEAAIVESLEPRPPGPKPKPPAEKVLEAEVERLQKENLKLKKQLQAADDMMGAAGEIIRHLRGLPPSRASSPRSKRTPKTSGGDEDPEPAPTKSAATMATETAPTKSAATMGTPAPTKSVATMAMATEPAAITSDATLTAILGRTLQQLTTRSSLGVNAARALGVDPKTLRRWLGRLVAGEPLVRRRGGTRRAGSPEAEGRICTLVRDLHGLIGADALAHSVAGVSRRRAAELKCETLTAIERERQAACSVVSVSRPGVVRGFDAMDLATGHALIAGDAAIPFRTSIEHTARYDAMSVAKVLEADFEIHGPPLVMRFDRARCHDAEPVMLVLDRHGVIALHGPAYYPQYYGQLERQNQEHRAWWDLRLPTSTPIQSQLDTMKSALNERWLRPTLNWRNAAQCWNERPALDEDRDALRVEVDRRTARLQDSMVHPDLAKRLAIEQALTERGYLEVRRGRNPLCE